jgi:hypothetical protein
VDQETGFRRKPEVHDQTAKILARGSKEELADPKISRRWRVARSVRTKFRPQNQRGVHPFGETGN